MKTAELTEHAPQQEWIFMYCLGGNAFHRIMVTEFAQHDLLVVGENAESVPAVEGDYGYHIVDTEYLADRR